MTDPFCSVCDCCGDQAVWLGVDIQCVPMGFDVFGTASRACFVTFVLALF